LVRNFRNITSADIRLSSQFNLFYGANGSGKTSILETLSLLAHGKSFRSHLSTPLVQHGVTKAVVFSQLEDLISGLMIPVGIEKDLRQGTSIRVNRVRAKTSSELARLVPLLVVDSNAFSIVDGPSKHRRKILDWLVFHVEPRFHQSWLSYYGALKQRNALLRRGIMRGQELASWTKHCIDHGSQLDAIRIQVFQSLVEQMAIVIDRFNLPLTVDFFPGWKHEFSLAEEFERQLESDIRQQTTKTGPHRADLLLTCREGKVAEVFSRGQKKMTILALCLAVLSGFCKVHADKPVVALDDLPAELDQLHLEMVLALLSEQAQQVFITAINLDQIRDLIPIDVDLKLFHVEQGIITEIDG